MIQIDIIGGSGFIGTRLCDRLATSNLFRFSVFDKNRSHSYPHLTKIGDVRSQEDLRASLTDEAVIINLAAIHRDDERPLSLYQDVNVGGAINICAIAEEKKTRTIIFTSTVAVYGFAPVGTNESGAISPFNEYGRTKFEAEKIFQSWQAAAPNERSLIILRPTVVFGEKNRGNVFNLLRQIASGRFVMIGDGNNRKSMTYVENVAAFLEYAIDFKPGVHIYNVIDKPDFNMNSLVENVRVSIGRSPNTRFRLPYLLGLTIAKCFDAVAIITNRRFSISAIRVKKFCADSVFETSIAKTGFKAPISLAEALDKTIRYEFLETHDDEERFFTE